MARCSDLPLELIALIINFHRDAQSTLRQCSLVCRAWRSPSQRQLFHAFRHFYLLDNVGPFRTFLLGAPHICAYIRKFRVLGSNSYRYNYTPEEGPDAALRKEVQDLFSLLPNITKMEIYFLPSFPSLFPNSLLRQFPALRKITIGATFQLTRFLSPTAIFPSFKDTSVKSLDLTTLVMPSEIDSPFDLHSATCSIERLTLDQPRSLAVWLPFFRSVLPRWNELKIVCPLQTIRTWGDVLRTLDLSHLRQLYVRVSICPDTHGAAEHFPSNDAPSLVSSTPKLDHLLLTTQVTYRVVGNLSIEVVFSMVEWYLSTFTALSQGGACTLKELTLTVMALDDSTVAAAWAKVDDILSSNAFSWLEHVHFLDEAKNPIKRWSYPNTVGMLQQALPKLSTGGKLAV